MSNVIVTGGAGFIGSHVVDHFVQRGDAVLVVDDLSSGEAVNVNAGAELLEMDIRDKALRSKIQEFRPDTIVHAAAQMSVPDSMKDPEFDADVNVCGLVNILQALDKDNLPHFVFFSTGGAIYGEQEEFPCSEGHPIRPDSFYGLSKRVGEMYLESWSRIYGLKYSALRLSNIYGPRQNPHGEAGVVAIFSKKLIANETPLIFGTGEQTRDYLFVGDLVAAVAAVVEQGVSGTFNIGTGVETSVNALLQEICAALEIELCFEKKPARPGEQFRSVVGSAYAQESFGWSPKHSLKEGVTATTEWFKQEG